MCHHPTRRSMRHLLAAVAGTIALTLVGSPIRASGPPISPPDPSPVGGGPAPVESVPEGYVRLVDDTGLLTIVVPTMWTDVDPVPAEDVNGQPQPWLAASTDIDRFLQSFDASGALFTAFAYDPDPQFLIDQFSLLEGCTEFVVESFDDGRFVGLVQRGVGCGESGEASWTLIVANPIDPTDQSLTAMVQLQSAAPADEEAVRIAQESFATTSDVSSGSEPTGPGSSVPAPTASTASTEPG